MKMCKKDNSLHTSQVAHQAGAYPGFCSMKQLGVFLPLLEIHLKILSNWTRLKARASFREFSNITRLAPQFKSLIAIALTKYDYLY